MSKNKNNKISKVFLIVVASFLLLSATGVYGLGWVADNEKTVNNKQRIQQRIKGGLFISKAFYLKLTKQRCSKPIKYSIGSIDPKFKISKEELKEALKKAEEAWESEDNKDFFQYDDQAKFKINLIYDERQKLNQDKKLFDEYTEKFKIADKKDKEEYERMKKEHERLVDYLFAAEKKLMDDKFDLEDRIIEYNYSWDLKKTTEKKLKKERKDLIARQNKFNQQVSYEHSLVNKMNKLAKRGKERAEEYNNKIEEFKKEHNLEEGRVFEEGEYSRDLNSEQINIYSFWDQEELAMILVHEFGHALGMAHVDNPDSIMYYLNKDQGKNKKWHINEDDLKELHEVCDL